MAGVILSTYSFLQLKHRARQRTNQQTKLAFSLIVASEDHAKRMQEASTLRREWWNEHIRGNNAAADARWALYGNTAPTGADSCPPNTACGPVGDAEGAGCVSAQSLGCWPGAGLAVPPGAPPGFRPGDCINGVRGLHCWWRESSIRYWILKGIENASRAFTIESAHAANQLADSVENHPGFSKNLAPMSCAPGPGMHELCMHCPYVAPNRVGCAKIEICDPNDPDADPLSANHQTERCSTQVVHLGIIRMRRVLAGSADDALTGAQICADFAATLGGVWKCVGGMKTGPLHAANPSSQRIWCDTASTISAIRATPAGTPGWPYGPFVAGEEVVIQCRQR